MLLKGETAELGVCVGSDNPKAIAKFNWAGVMIGLFHPEKMILGDTLKEGQVIMALEERGFRCNGLSGARKALAIAFGKKWWANPRAKEAIQACARPSVLYDPLLTTANGWGIRKRIPMSLIVHLTGGAFVSKFWKAKLLPRGLSARLDDLFDPPEIMKQCAQWRGMSEEEAYEVWHGGQGALVVLDETYVTDFRNLAAQYNIAAKVCGRIEINPTPSLTIISKYGSGAEILYQP